MTKIDFNCFDLLLIWFADLLIDIDFSENLKFIIWATMIVLLQCSNHHTFWHGKTSQRKTLPPLCVWQQRKHDLTFATHILKEMLETVEKYIIESENCYSHYKSAKHFDNIQSICIKIGVPIICLFSVMEHGKGEVKRKIPMLGD